MAKLGKYLALLLLIALAVHLFLMDTPTDAQTIPLPSIPEFTIKFVNGSHAETTINAYTGIQETELIGNDTIEIKITNQHFTYSNYQIYYNVRSKPHFEGNWTEVYPVVTGASSYEGGYNYSYAQYINHYSIQQSETSYTTIIFTVRPTELYQATGYDVMGVGYYGIPYGSQLDFQVEAQVGHPSQRWVSDHPLLPVESGGFEPAVAYDTSSGWSNTKTVSIGETLTSISPSPTVPEFPTMAILPLFVVIPLITVFIMKKRICLKAYN